MSRPEGDPQAPDEEALARALRFIDYRPRSRGETVNRLARWGYSRQTADEVADYLERCEIIDDREFARVYIDEMLRKGLGFYRIRRALLEKRLDRSLVDELMDEYPLEDELARAERTAESLVPRLGSGESPGYDQKLVGRLVRRGYSRQIAMEACRNIRDVDTQNWRE